MKKFLVIVSIAIVLTASLILYIIWTPYGLLDPGIGCVLKIKDPFNRQTRFDSVPLDTLRKNITASSILAGKKWKGLKNITNQIIHTGQFDIPVRIYYLDNNRTTPIILYFHGGGFVYGSTESHDSICRYLALKSKYTVISVDYKLAPENPYPAPINEAFEVLKWLKANSPNKIFICGDSAGGNISAVICLKARDTGIKGIAGQILFYPSVNISRVDTESYRKYSKGLMLTKKDVEWFRDQYLPDTNNWTNFDVSPLLSKNFSNLPPALVITAEFDVLRDEGEEYGIKLNNSGTPAKVIRMNGMVHGFVSMNKFIKSARKAMDSAVEFMNMR